MDTGLRLVNWVKYQAGCGRSSAPSTDDPPIPQSAKVAAEADQIFIQVSEASFADRISLVLQEPLIMLDLLDGIGSLQQLHLSKAVELCGLVAGDKRSWWATKFISESFPSGIPFALTMDEAAAVHLYTQQWINPDDSLYRRLNAALRNADRVLIRPYFSYMALLLGALNKLPKFSNTVYRGVRGNLSSQYPKGTDGVWWAFSSCTKSVEALESPLFCGQEGDRTVFAIRNVSGVCITDFSAFKNEDEVLLPAGFQFQVDSIADMGHGLRIVQLSEKRSEFKLVE
eukprot:TRINITY_DN14028_c0_g1_i1.p1 TRINITY_DN14028_c0_g1~~TRINITY_DN14028_c0_g1_i1.p1  ORF type:complete len:285 (+),score=36.64 TRINITY_DN14028_c0_g1_i1:58-912(+)